MGTPEIPFPESSYEDVTPVGGGAGDFGPDNPSWGVLGAIGVVIMSFIFMAITQFGFIAVYLFYRVFYRGAALSTEVGGMMQNPTAIFVAVASIVPAHLLTVGLAWVLVTGTGKRPFLRSLGWEWTRGFTFWRCAGIAVGLLLAGFVILKVTGAPQTELDQLIESSRAAAFATAFLATVTAPFTEELTYRGVLYPTLERAAGRAWAIAIVGLLFAGIHVYQYRQSYGVVATILLLSFALTFIRARSGRLLPCFVVHLVFNGIQSLLIVLNPYIERFSPDKTPTPAPGALLHLFAKLFTLHL